MNVFRFALVIFIVAFMSSCNQELLPTTGLTEAEKPTNGTQEKSSCSCSDDTYIGASYYITFGGDFGEILSYDYAISWEDTPSANLTNIEMGFMTNGGQEFVFDYDFKSCEDGCGGHNVTVDTDESGWEDDLVDFFFIRRVNSSPRRCDSATPGEAAIISSVLVDCIFNNPLLVE